MSPAPWPFWASKHWLCLADCDNSHTMLARAYNPDPASGPAPPLQPSTGSGNAWLLKAKACTVRPAVTGAHTVLAGRVIKILHANVHQLSIAALASVHNVLARARELKIPSCFPHLCNRIHKLWRCIADHGRSPTAFAEALGLRSFERPSATSVIASKALAMQSWVWQRPIICSRG